MTSRKAPSTPTTTEPATERPAHVVVELREGKRWDTTNERSAEFSRTVAAVHLLVNDGATAQPELTDDELRAGAREAFQCLEVQRNGAPHDVYLSRFPKRRSCYLHIAALLGCEEVA